MIANSRQSEPAAVRDSAGAKIGGPGAIAASNPAGLATSGLRGRLAQTFTEWGGCASVWPRFGPLPSPSRLGGDYLANALIPLYESATIYPERSLNATPSGRTCRHLIIRVSNSARIVGDNQPMSE